MDTNQLNQLIARLVVSKNIIPRDRVQRCALLVRDNLNLGQVLVSRELLTQKQYQQIYTFLVNKYGPVKEEAKPFPENHSHPVSPNRPETPRLSDHTQRPVKNREPSVPTGEPQWQAQPVRPETNSAPPSPPHQDHKPIPHFGDTRGGTLKGRKLPLEKKLDDLPQRFRESEAGGEQTIDPPRTLSKQNSLQEILVLARKMGASDVHISPGSPIFFRRFGRLQPASDQPLSAGDIQVIVENALTAEQLEELKSTGDLEFAFILTGYGRYRMTFAEQRFGWEFTCRVVDWEVRPMKDAGLPDPCKSLTQWAQGLVLVTGPLGCGKSSTMATLVEMINQNRKEHIITIENPVEIVYKPWKCQITQREIGRHTLSPANALRAALRQDPDILVVGELRDLETIRLAVSAAETGHLVFGTMNTNNATRTINRLIDSFPTGEQDIMRTMISESLRGIISQQLVPRKDGRGVVPAFEVLIVTKAVANMIRKDALHQVESAMVSGRSQGMILLDDSLKGLVEKGEITGEEAFFRASNPKVFKSFAPNDLRGMFIDG